MIGIVIASTRLRPRRSIASALDRRSWAIEISVTRIIVTAITVFEYRKKRVRSPRRIMVPRTLTVS